MNYSRLWHDAFMYVTRCIHVCACVCVCVCVWHGSIASSFLDYWFFPVSAETYLYVGHDSFAHYLWRKVQSLVAWTLTWLVNACYVHESYVWHHSFICVVWLVHMRWMTRSYVWNDSFISVTWVVHTCDMTYVYVWHDSLICGTSLIYPCDMTPLYE